MRDDVMCDAMDVDGHDAMRSQAHADLHRVVDPFQLDLTDLEMEAPALTASKHCGKRVQERQGKQGERLHMTVQSVVSTTMCCLVSWEDSLPSDSIRSWRSRREGWV